jgi:gamma-glutamyltranspeptidase/glutathione hydrolase
MGNLTLDPATWDRHDIDALLQPEPQPLEAHSVAAPTAMVTGSTGRFAQRAGRHALELGGSAADAAITTALAQITLALGSWVSFAGIATAVYYEASSGTVQAMSAGWAVPAAETDGMSIPTGLSGRCALIPGFFAGMHALHERYGRLPWADLFLPALWLADHGFPLSKRNALELKWREARLKELPETREVFLADGTVPEEGDVFRQPQLAATLRKIAADGVDVVYRGAWAERYVEVTRREGGVATLEDLAAYQPMWGEPLTGSVNGYDLHVVPGPGYGGAALIDGLQLMEEGGVGDPPTSGEDLFWAVQVTRQVHLHSRVPNPVRVDREFTRATWKEMAAVGGAKWSGVYTPGACSDFVAAKDTHGDVIALCHTSNVGAWGDTCLMADGISIPDPGRYQQPGIAKCQPGAHLPDPTNPAIVTRNGKAVLASTSIGAGLTETTLQCMSAVLLRGASVAEAAAAPMFQSPDVYVASDDSPGGGARWSKDATPDEHVGMFDAPYWRYLERAQTMEERFPEDIRAGAEAKGLPFKTYSFEDPALPRGYWTGIAVDPVSGACQGAKTPFRDGAIDGF